MTRGALQKSNASCMCVVCMQHAPHRPFALSVVPFPIIVLGNKFQEIVSAWFSLGMPKTDDYILFIYYVMCRVEGPLNLGLLFFKLVLHVLAVCRSDTHF